MIKKRGFVINSVSGRPNSFANVDMVQSITIVDQEMNMPAFKEKVHLWNTIKVSAIATQLTFCHDCYHPLSFHLHTSSLSWLYYAHCNFISSCNQPVQLIVQVQLFVKLLVANRFLMMNLCKFKLDACQL